MREEMAKVYSFEQEQEIYENWEESGYFTPSVDPDKKPYTVMMPPPNITGELHMGHALGDVLQDILIRTKRMQGYAALWVPGSDHASIATEVKIVEDMAKENLTKEDIGREAFLERAWKWKEQYGGKITKQVRKLGCSCDWTRERFTLDERLTKAVIEAFVRLYEEGLIYRGDRIINWCVTCNTALSDAEVEYEEQQTSLWHLAYATPDGKDKIVVATTRPETMLGDTAVAVHPDDKRYQHLIGKTLLLPIVNREIPVVADEEVEMDFGTGAVKITPAHDFNDFDIAQRHNLPAINIMDEDGIINEHGKHYQGMDRIEARDAIVKELEKLGVLVQTEDYTHNVGTCYRCDTTVEPIISKQWFISMKELAAPAIDIVKNGETKFVPKRFDKIYFNWMDNIRDWCISRQLWWGHRIPAWYCDDCDHITVARQAPTACEKCHSKNIRQEEDVLDTWFSSGLWPFSTLGWPEKTADLNYFYPTNTLITGSDIIFFWVARMIFFGAHFLGEKPFDVAMLHGIIRDDQGRKMSKSLGNGIDPLEIVEEYGADALRFSLVQNTSLEGDMRFYIERVESARNFANKVWNASRFVLMNVGEYQPKGINYDILTKEDAWILHELNQTIQTATQSIDDYEVGIAAHQVYDFLWSDYCDWYIEMVKPRLQQEGEDKNNALEVLIYVLSNTLKLLHPFMPFITEQIFQSIFGKEKSIMVQPWPEVHNDTEDIILAAQDVEGRMEVIRAIRNIRSEFNVPQGKKTPIYLLQTKGRESVLENLPAYFERLIFASEVQLLEHEKNAPENSATAITAFAQIFIPTGELVDTEKEIARMQKELEKIESEIKRSEGMLQNPGFVENAPEKIVTQEKEKLEENKDKYVRVQSQLEILRK